MEIPLPTKEGGEGGSLLEDADLYVKGFVEGANPRFLLLGSRLRSLSSLSKTSVAGRFVVAVVAEPDDNEHFGPSGLRRFLSSDPELPLQAWFDERKSGI